MVVLGGGAVSYERGTPVPNGARHPCSQTVVPNGSNAQRQAPAFGPYRGTPLTRTRTHLGPYPRPMPRVLGGSQGVSVFLWARFPCRPTCRRCSIVEALSVASLSETFMLCSWGVQSRLVVPRWHYECVCIQASSNEASLCSRPSCWVCSLGFMKSPIAAQRWERRHA